MDQRTVEIINELLAAEQASTVRRVVESTAFVSPLSARQASAVRNIAGEMADHGAWLVDLLSRAGRSPGPRFGNVRSADLHFLDISHALPRIIADFQRLANMCDRGARLVQDSDASSVIAKMAERHRTHAETLRKLQHDIPEAHDAVAVAEGEAKSEDELSK